MLPSRRVSFALLLWLAGMASCLAQTRPTDAPPAWSTLFDATPVLWAGILVTATVTTALLVQWGFLLLRSRIDPPGFIESLSHAIRSGNYQEGWETCNRWRQTAMARMLQPALERIGQGQEPVETRLADEHARERQSFALLSWLTLAAAFITILLCIVAMVGEGRVVDAQAFSAEGPRAFTLSMGRTAMLWAIAIAVFFPTVAAWVILRARAAEALLAAKTHANELVAKLPYEEIEGLRIGRDFNAGTILGEGGDEAAGRPLQVSKTLTTLCPTCNGPINVSQTACPTCGQRFTWS